MSTHHHSGGGSGISGLKIPKRFLIITGLILLGFFLAQGITPAFELSDQISLLIHVASAGVFGLLAMRFTGTHSHGSGSHGHGHGHGHGMSLLDWTKVIVLLAIALFVVGGWLYEQRPEARRKEMEQTKKFVSFLEKLDDETGAVTGKKYELTAPVLSTNWMQTVPSKSTSVPAGFSEPVPIPPHAEYAADTVGPTGPYLLWDGNNVHLCEVGKEHKIRGVTHLAFGSVTNYPLKFSVLVKPKKYTY
jgi:hypothetical protein